MRAAILVCILDVVTVSAFRQIQRRSAATPVPTPEGTVKRVVWGGADRGQSNYMQEDGSTNVWKKRPEWAKLERCTDEGCTECDGNDRCWYGRGAWFEVMETDTSDANQYKNFTMVAHAKCNSGYAQSSVGVRTYTPVGGTLTIYWDAELVKTVSAGDAQTDFNAKLLPEEPKELRLTWTPTDPSATPSKVQVSVWASDVSAGFDQCQDREACLEVLSTEPNAEAGWKLREENHLLKQFLDGNTGSFDRALRDKCDDWLKCVSGTPGMRQHFENVLEAANVDGTAHSALLESADDRRPKRLHSLTNEDLGESCFKHVSYTGDYIDIIQSVKSASACQRLCQEHSECGIFEYAGRFKRCTRRKSPGTVSPVWRSKWAQRWSGPKYCDTPLTTPDFPGCIDPAIADVFSWECDCYENAVAECERNTEFAGMSTSECLNVMTCASDKVCPSWVAKSCRSTTALLQSSLNSSVVFRQNQDALAKHAQSGKQQRGLAMDESLGAKSCI